MFVHRYLEGALKRRKLGKLNYRDRFYTELFRKKKDFSNWPSYSSITSSIFNYILDNYERTILNKEKYFCLYKECGDYSDYLWLLNCLRMIDVFSISFPDILSKKEFLSVLEQQIGDNPFPVIDAEERVVVNATNKEYWESMFGVLP